MFLFVLFCHATYSQINVTQRNRRQSMDSDSEAFTETSSAAVIPGLALNPVLVQEAALAKKIRLGEARELSPDDLVVTLQEERRKILTEIYGFDPLEATFGDYDLGITSPPVPKPKEDDKRKNGLDTTERKLLRKLIMARRLRRFRNRARLFGTRNPYIAMDIVGK